MTPDISLRKQALESLDRLRGRAEMLEAVVPKSIGGSPAFDAFLHALVRPLTTYIDWAGGLLAEDDPNDGESPQTAGAIPAGTGVGESDPSAATHILADSQRLIGAVDAFIATPLADDVRAGLVSLLNEVLRPALASTRPAVMVARPSATVARAAGPQTTAQSERAATPDPAHLEPPNLEPPNRDPRQAADQDEVTDPLLSAHRLASEHKDAGDRPAQTQPRHPVEQRMDEVATAASRGITPDRRLSEQPAPPSGVAPMRPDDAMTHWWQERFEQLNRRMNVGFMLMGAVGLGLMALNLYETFSRPRLGIEVVEAAAPRTEPDPAVSAPVVEAPAALAGMDLAAFEGLARQLQASGEDIASLLAQWNSGPGTSVEALESRMLAMEAEFSRLRVDLDAMGASFQVDAETYAMADAGDAAPRAETGAEMSMSLDPDDDADSASRIDEAGDTDALPIEVAEAEESMQEPILAEGMVTDDGSERLESAPLTMVVPAQEVILAAPAYGIQLGAMRRESGARALAEKTAIDPALLFIQASGSWQFVILGWFADQEEASAALANLPRSTRRLRPLIRFVEAGSRVTPLNAL